MGDSFDLGLDDVADDGGLNLDSDIEEDVKAAKRAGEQSLPAVRNLQGESFSYRPSGMRQRNASSNGDGTNNRNRSDAGGGPGGDARFMTAKQRDIARQRQRQEIAFLQKQNNSLRNQLKEFSLALDANIRRQKQMQQEGDVAASNLKKPRPGVLYNTKSHAADVREQELANVNKKIEIYKVSNESLRKQINSSLNPRIIGELENKLAAKQLEMTRLTEENKALKKELKRIDREFKDVNKAATDYPKKIATMMEELQAFKEKLRKYVIRHNEDEVAMRKQQQHLVVLDEKTHTLQAVLQQRRERNRELYGDSDDSEDGAGGSGQRRRRGGGGKGKRRRNRAEDLVTIKELKAKLANVRRINQEEENKHQRILARSKKQVHGLQAELGNMEGKLQQKDPSYAVKKAVKGATRSAYNRGAASKPSSKKTSPRVQESSYYDDDFDDEFDDDDDDDEPKRKAKDKNKDVSPPKAGRTQIVYAKDYNQYDDYDFHNDNRDLSPARSNRYIPPDKRSSSSSSSSSSAKKKSYNDFVGGNVDFDDDDNGRFDNPYEKAKSPATKASRSPFAAGRAGGDAMGADMRLDDESAELDFDHF